MRTNLLIAPHKKLILFDYIIPGFPPAGFSSLISITAYSVVNSIADTDAAYGFETVP